MYDRYILKGSVYEMGLEAGRIFKDPINAEIAEYEERLKDEKTAALVRNIEDRMRAELPLCLEELYGRADGAGVNREALILFYSPEVYLKPDGCTTVFYRKKDRVLFSHNEDDEDCDHKNRALIKFDFGDRWFVGFSDYHKLTGSSFSYNSHGIVCSCNYLFHSEVDLDNLSRYIVSRDMLDAGSIGECLDKLKSHRPASAFSCNILDINTLEACNIENDLKDMYITDITGKFSRSNHFLNRKDAIMSDNSRYRFLKAKERMEALDETADIDGLRDVLRYEDREYVRSIFMDPLKYGPEHRPVTVANFSIDTLTKTVKIFDGLDHSEYVTDFHTFTADSK